MKSLEKVRKVAKMWAGVVITLAVVWTILELVFPLTDTETPLLLLDWILIALFPVLTLAGMLLAFRWELWGSLLTLISAAAFLGILYSQDRLNDMLAMIVLMVVVVFPAVLFLWSWNLDRNRQPLAG